MNSAEEVILKWESTYHDMSIEEAREDGYLHCTNDLCESFRYFMDQVAERCAEIGKKMAEEVVSQYDPKIAEGVAVEIAAAIRAEFLEGEKRE